jgi:hypothetical protein
MYKYDTQCIQLHALNGCFALLALVEEREKRGASQAVIREGGVKGLEGGSSLQLLRGYHCCINTAHSHEFIMFSLFDDAAGIENKDTICVLYAG